MDDLGELPSLADVLLGNDPVHARDRLLEYARLLAVFARRSAARIDEYDAPLGHPGHFAIIQLREGLAQLGAPPAVGQALLDITTRLEAATDWMMVGPGDGCPDNVLVAPHGLCILDFEGAARYHAAFDVGSLAVPFPSCWCHDAFDEELRAALLAAHSRRVRPRRRRVRRRDRADHDRVERVDVDAVARSRPPPRVRDAVPEPGDRPSTRARRRASDRGERDRRTAHLGRGSRRGARRRVGPDHRPRDPNTRRCRNAAFNLVATLPKVEPARR